MVLVVKRMSPAQIAALAAEFGGQDRPHDLDVQIRLVGEYPDMRVQAKRNGKTVTVGPRGWVEGWVDEDKPAEPAEPEAGGLPPTADELGEAHGDMDPLG